MRSSDECLVKATAMDLRALIATSIYERDEYTALADGWRDLAKAAAYQDAAVKP